MKKTLLATEAFITTAILLGVSGQVKADKVNDQPKQNSPVHQTDIPRPASEVKNENQNQNQVLIAKPVLSQNAPQITYQRQSRQLTETIYFQDTAGQEIAQPQKQTVTVTRTNILRDGEVIKYGAWSKKDFAQVKAPQITGYTPTQPYLDALPANQSFYFIWQYRKTGKSLANKQNTFQPAPVHPQSIETTPLKGGSQIQSDNSQLRYPAQDLKNTNDYKTSASASVDGLDKNYEYLNKYQKSQELGSHSISTFYNEQPRFNSTSVLPQTGTSSSAPLSLIGLCGSLTLIGLCGYRKIKQINY